MKALKVPDNTIKDRLLRPGEWCWLIQEGYDRELHFCTPNDHHGAINDSWEIIGDDENITVSPSIKVSDNKKELWHGYLTNGQWRDC